MLGEQDKRGDLERVTALLMCWLSPLASILYPPDDGFAFYLKCYHH